MQEVDPWKLIEKFRQQHKEEIHNIWMPLVQHYKEMCEDLQNQINTMQGESNG